MAKTRGIVEKKSFSLNDYKKKKGIDNVMFKPEEWLELGEEFKEVTGLPGFLTGVVNLIIGHSDTSKSTAMILAAISSQKKGRIPVFVITEMKWSWSHAKFMGLEFEEVADPDTGELNYEGNFIYVDKLQLKSIEDVATFINKMLDDQEKGDLPFGLDFIWDSVGSIPCNMSIEKAKNNPEWNALAMSTQFGGSVNQRITSSRRVGMPYTNTLIVVNKVWVEKPSVPMGQPKIKPKGGTTMYFDAALVVRFGNIASSGINKIKATKNGRDLYFASRVSVNVEKNHVNGVSTGGKIIVTPHGYILDDKKEIDKYKKDNLDYFSSILGDSVSDGDFSIEVEQSEDNFDLTQYMEDNLD
jgi:hypothetical protein